MTTAAKPAATRATAPARRTGRVGRVRGPRIPPPIVGTLPWERSHAGIDIEVCQGFRFAERERLSYHPGRGPWWPSVHRNGPADSARSPTCSGALGGFPEVLDRELVVDPSVWSGVRRPRRRTVGGARPRSL